MPVTDNATRERVRDLNDTFHKTLDPALGRVMLTAGVDALPSDVRAMAIRKVATFAGFSADIVACTRRCGRAEKRTGCSATIWMGRRRRSGMTF
jgi:hypothetical protein